MLREFLAADIALCLSLNTVVGVIGNDFGGTIYQYAQPYYVVE
jgi:hypothetical protein